ncbi:MAG: VWA domain-containing protein [Acidobacteriota bacterium]
MNPSLFRVSLLSAALLVAALPAFSQEEVAPQDPAAGTFTEVTNVRVISVDVFVTDRSGDPVGGLAREDFELFVDGQRTPISNFYSEVGGRVRESVTPVERQRETRFTPIEQVQAAAADRRTHVVVMVDHSRLRPANRKRAFRALREAVAQLDDEDLISVVGVETGLVFYSDFLFDRQAIGEILDDLEEVRVNTEINEIERRQIYGLLARGQSGAFLARASSNIDGGQILSRIQAYAAEEFNRSLGALRSMQGVIATMGGIEGRKALLWLGEGVVTRPGEGMFVEWRNRFGAGSDNVGVRRIDFDRDYTRTVGRYDLTDAMDRVADAANGAGVTIYAVDAEGNHGGIIRSALTEQGSTSEAISVVDENYRAPLEFATQATGGRLLRSSGKLAEQLAGLTRDFSTFYSLGFTVPEDWEAGTDHGIEVKVSGKRRTVRYREKVRLPKTGEKEAGATVASLLYETSSNPLEIQATPGSEAPREDGTAALPILIEIPVGKLDLVPTAETHNASLSIYVTVKDKNGNPRPVQTVPFHLNIPNDKVEDARARAAHYSLPLVIRAGDQQAAIGVRDNVSGSFATIRVDLAQYSQSL